MKLHRVIDIFGIAFDCIKIFIEEIIFLVESFQGDVKSFFSLKTFSESVKIVFQKV
jgi:hypothetical protein